MSDAATALKICGLTNRSQACSIAAMGVQAIGVIGVEQTPRFVAEPTRRSIFAELERLHPNVERVWVVANPSDHAVQSALQGQRNSNHRSTPWIRNARALPSAEAAPSSSALVESLETEDCRRSE